MTSPILPAVTTAITALNNLKGANNSKAAKKLAANLRAYTPPVPTPKGEKPPRLTREQQLAHQHQLQLRRHLETGFPAVAAELAKVGAADTIGILASAMMALGFPTNKIRETCGTFTKKCRQAVEA